MLLDFWFRKMIQRWYFRITRVRVVCTMHKIPLLDGWPYWCPAVWWTQAGSCCNSPKRINALHDRCISLATSLFGNICQMGVWTQDRSHLGRQRASESFTPYPSRFDPTSLMEGIKRRCKGAINDAYHLCTISCSIPCLVMACKSAMQSDPLVID